MSRDPPESEAPHRARASIASADAAEWALEARGVSKSYGPRPALSDVSLQVALGEGVALLGPNGSGKTTLLSLFAGVLKPDRGVALVLGKASTRRSARRALAFVPQDTAVYDGLSAEENATLFARLYGLRGAELASRVRDALEAADLHERRAARAGSLSGGMRKRLSVACALVHAPSALLLDEPFEGVDDASRDHLTRILLDAKQRGTALVLSTHRLDEAGALCDRFIAMREGHIVADQRPLHSDARTSTDLPRAEVRQ